MIIDKDNILDPDIQNLHQLKSNMEEPGARMVLVEVLDWELPIRSFHQLRVRL